MGDFILPIFPPGSLDSSVITATWIGVMVSVFFNLRFGWVLSGLVVPGYLVPLIIIKPWSAAVVGIEGVATYAIVWLFSEFCPRFGWWSSLFGRDRFFALVLVSIAVRLVFDSWLLPTAGEWVVSTWGIAFDYRNNLHSFGLIVVALLANQFWKTGFFRGIIPVATTLGLTWLLIRFGLMEFTNFRISDIGFLYEDLAGSLLATPKAYMILVVTAFLASRLNLRYGWDFNGILIPSLIALQWYQPVKILTSVFEAFVILGLSILILRLPLFATATVEGGRKLLMFFSVGFAYKIALGFALPMLLPGVKVTDYFGFGYLLSTLIAMKIHDKEILARLTRATLQTSAIGATVATIVGFGLTLLPPFWSWTERQVIPSIVAAERSTNFVRLDELIRERVVGVYAATAALPPPPPHILDPFERTTRRLLSSLRGADETGAQDAMDELARMGLAAVTVEGRYIVIESPENRHWGTFILDRESKSELVLEIPDPLQRRGLMDASMGLANALGFRGLALAGISQTRTGQAAAENAIGFGSLFHAFHRALGGRDVLQVKAHGRASAAALTGLRSNSEEELARTPPGLWAKAPLPASLDLNALGNIVGKPQVTWGVSPVPSLQAEFSRGAYAELFLSAPHIRRVIARTAETRSASIAPTTVADTPAWLRQTLIGSKDSIAVAGSDLYRPPQLNEMMFLDAEVIAPLVAATDHVAAGRLDDSALQEQLQVISVAAAQMGFRLSLLRDGTGGQFLVLSEDGGPERRYWGTAIFRLGERSGTVIQVPRPVYEANTLEAALSLFDSLKAAALVVAGADSRANRDGSADLIAPGNIRNMLNLVSQVILRDTTMRPIQILQMRGFGARDAAPPLEADAVMVSSSGAASADKLPLPAREALEAVRSLGLSVEVSSGDTPATTGLAPGALPQAQYLDQTEGADLALIWLSPSTRKNYRAPEEGATGLAAFEATAIPTEEVILTQWLESRPWVQTPVAPQLRAQVDRFVSSSDVVSLWQAQLSAKKLDFRLVRLVDGPSRKAFLAITDRNGRPLALGHLAPFDRGDVLTGSGDALGGFIEGRGAWLLPEKGG